MSRSPENELEDEERIGCFRLLTRFVGTTLVCAVILLGAAGFFVGTDGFRAFFAGRAEVAWRVPFRLAKSGWGGDGSILLENVEVGSGSEQVAVGFRAEEVRLRGNPFSFVWKGGRGGLRRLDAEHWELVFVQDREGAWRPAPLQPAAQWLNDALDLGLEILPDAEASLRAPGLRLTHGVIRWVDPEGQELVRLEGLQLDATPLSLPGRTALHIRLEADRVVGLAAGGSASGAELEVLRTEGQDIVLRAVAVEKRGVLSAPRSARAAGAVQEREPLAPVDVEPPTPVTVEPLSPEDAAARVRSELQDALDP